MSQHQSHRYLFLLSALLIILVVSTPTAFANYYIDGFGQIFYQDNGAILGKTDNRPAVSKKPETESETISEPTPLPTGPQIIDKRSQKIEIKNERNQLKFQFVDQNSQPLTSGDSTPSSQIRIEEPADTDTITLTSTNSASQIIRNKITAQTHFPLMVNLETNELIVTTPKGEKVVTILPDQAVAHMLAANVLDQAGGKGGLLWLASLPTITPPTALEATPTIDPTVTPEATPTVEPTLTPEPEPTTTLDSTASTGDQVVLTQQDDGVLTYEIPGSKTKKLFGFYKITLQRTAIVSAETGELITVRQSPSDRILDLLSR